MARADSPLPPPDRNHDQIFQDPQLWWDALTRCLASLANRCELGQIRCLAIDGTSATVLLCDADGTPLAPALMYNDRRARDQAGHIAAVATDDSAAISASSSLAKSLWLLEQLPDTNGIHIQHQADWISGRLTGNFTRSDYHNALKLGYDVRQLAWPEWLGTLGIPANALPTVVAPGEVLGTVTPEIAGALGLSKETRVVAGTTDSIAAFLASGASQPGDAVTSLGSTLVLKLLSETPVFSAKYGIYSHRLGDQWLVGGASNSGGAVLKQFFSDEELSRLSQQLQPAIPTGLDYYPLVDKGERFPVNDPDLAPAIEPRPKDPVVFLQGLLEGIAAIEQQGYQLLTELGAPALRRVFTMGGGSHNAAWTRIREQKLGAPILPAVSVDAAFGTALLALGAAR